MARRIALLCGGASGEREVSLLSAAAVEEALEKRYEVIKIDTGVEGWAHTLLDSSVEGVFICLHGGAGENGSIQGFWRSLQRDCNGQICGKTVGRIFPHPNTWIHQGASW